jgi:hypothetical protein
MNTSTDVDLTLDQDREAPSGTFATRSKSPAGTAHRCRRMLKARGKAILQRLQTAAIDPRVVARLTSRRDVYSALAELVRRHGHATTPTTSDSLALAGNLTPYEFRVFSQNGEDGVIAEILRRIGVGNRFFVEFGIGGAIEGNCVFLADVLGWSGVFAEPELDAFAQLERKYHANPHVTTIRALITQDNVEDWFTSANIPTEFDVLSIDVDGNDYWIWRAIDHYSPRIVVIEYNGSLDLHSQVVQPPDATARWTGTEYYGASLSALRTLGETKGYSLAHTDLCGVNAFFVRSDLCWEPFDAASVPARAANFFFLGHGMPSDGSASTYVDPDEYE